MPEDQGGSRVEARESAPIPRLPERALAAREDALSIAHRMTHFPKNALCDICNRARLYSKRVRSHRIPDSEEDVPDPEKFGDQIACDHVIVFKSATKDEDYATFARMVLCENFQQRLSHQNMHHLHLGIL